MLHSSWIAQAYDRLTSHANRLFFLGFGVSFLNVTESDKRVEDGNGRVHDDRVILAVLSSEFEDPFEGAGEHTDSWILNPSLLQPSYKHESLRIKRISSISRLLGPMLLIRIIVGQQL